MDNRKIMIGVVLIVIAGVLLNLVLALFIVMIAAGTFIAFDGLGMMQPSTGQQVRISKLTALDKSILQMTSEGKVQDEIAKSTGVAPALIVSKTAALAAAGFINGTFLSEKGYEALRVS